MNIIVLSGSPLSLPSLQHLSNINMLSVLLCPEESLATEITPLQQWAAGKEVPFWQVNQQGLEQDIVELCKETTPDLLLVFGFPYTLPVTLANTLKHGCWNVHFSLYPNDQGSITIHQLEEGNEGQVIEQQNLTHDPDDQMSNPLERLSHLSVALLSRALAVLQYFERSMPVA